MAAANGFVSSAPDERYGASSSAFTNNIAAAQLFVMPGSGEYEIAEIGLYGNDSDEVRHMAIFTHDADNNCPNVIVENADIEVTLGASLAKCSATYVTKPIVYGGDTYWIALLGNTTVTVSYNATGATGLYRSATYPTWPTADDWHTHTDLPYDYSFYAVYASTSPTSQFARPSSDVAGGTFRSIQVTAPFGPRVIA